jgi:hypothetical protein
MGGQFRSHLPGRPTWRERPLLTIEHTFRVMTYDIDFAGVVSNISYIRGLEDLRNLFAEQTLSSACRRNFKSEISGSLLGERYGTT